VEDHVDLGLPYEIFYLGSVPPKEQLGGDQAEGARDEHDECGEYDLLDYAEA
jgi:hypothetical protein